MCPGRAWRLLLVLAACCAPMFAAGRVSEFLGVEQWHGTVKISGTGSGSSNGGIYSDVWQFGDTSSISLQLPNFDANIQGWTGTFKGTSNIGAQVVSTFSGCKETLSEIFQGSLGAGKTFTMHLQGENEYVFYPSDYQAAGATSMTSNTCAPGSEGGTGSIAWSPVMSTLVQELPASGFSLKGSQTVKMNSPVQPPSLVFGGSPAVIDVTITWDFEPGAVKPAELVVKKTSDLKSWRPTAGAGGAMGNSIALTAKLQEKGGGPTDVQAAYFIWEFTNCSKEPGYALNAPVANPGKDFDMKFEGGGNFLPPDQNAQKLQSKAGLYSDSTATVDSFDWGGFATFKVTAFLPDGSTLAGYLEGDTAQTDIRLPLRDANSSIADAWKKEHDAVKGQSDSSDLDNDPVGDGSKGDGLTLYEEYRGFIVDGKHVEGNPTKKDYFIVNQAGESYQPGIKLFQLLSGLEVHGNLQPSEIPANRVINSNHSQGPHVVDQHAVIIDAIAADAGYAEAIGGPGTPGMITHIVAPAILPTLGTHGLNYKNSTLAHELFHACNVWHHGNGGYETLTLTRYADDTVTSDGNDIIVLTEADTNGASMLPVDTPVKRVIGRESDPHVGDGNCVMRYDDASGYVSKSDPGAIYLFPQSEQAGTSLCISGEGTVYNDPLRVPQPRYGDATAGRGNCRSQILVNDAVPAPRR